MKNVVIGTAGHVDHGKTMLVKALTGIETDRLKEEKKRGITIEIGFAYVDFDNGERAGIIDVPGHEKFIKNMLAGAGGIDLAMLVVAADEGFMPQTVEHLGILQLLGIQKGVVVITKTDMVEEDWIQVIREDVADHVKGTFLENAPVVEVSAYTGKGIQELKALLQEMVAQVGAKNTHRPFRIPIDRVFSVEGFGTVITGTLIEGQLHVGDEVCIYPRELESRVRNLQVHGSDVQTAYAGQRVAVNLANLKKTDLTRGDVLAKPHSMGKTMMLDVRLTVLPQSERVVENNMQVHLYHETRSMLCKVVLLDREELGPGESCFAQLRLAEELCAKAGDRFVIRFYSPLETIGGGVILDPSPVKHKRHDLKVLEAIKVRESGSAADLVLQCVTEQGAKFQTRKAMLKALTMPEPEFDQELQNLLADGSVVEYAKDRYLAASTLDALGDTLTALLQEYHRANPLQPGMRKDEVRQKLMKGLDVPSSDGILALLEQAGRIQTSSQHVALAGFEVQYPPKLKKLRDQVEEIYRQAGFEVPAVDEVYQKFASDRDACRQVVEAMLADETLILASPQLFFHRENYEKALAMVRDHFAQNDTLTLAQFRDLLGTSRKYALPLLEYWDRIKVTRKVGDNRVLIEK